MEAPQSTPEAGAPSTPSGASEGLGSPETTEDVRDEQESIWEDERKKVREMTDRFGEGVDPKIEETVVGLNLSEFPTTQSCEGHLDRGHAGPWVDIAAKETWDEMFKGEKQMAVDIAKKFGITPDEVVRGWSDEGAARAELADTAYEKYEKKRGQAPMTEEFKEWAKENDEIHDKLQEQLDEFYTDRPDVPDDVRLKIDGISYQKRLHTGPGGNEYFTWLRADEITPEQRLNRAPKLAEYQSEMSDFAAFLKDKFLSGEVAHPEQ